MQKLPRDRFQKSGAFLQKSVLEGSYELTDGRTKIGLPPDSRID
jgi:hypothetical protein